MSIGSETFALQNHVNYFLYHLRMLPEAYLSLDTNRLTVVYFCVSGLDICHYFDCSECSELSECIPLEYLKKIEKQKKLKETIVNWVYSLQVSRGFLDDSFKKCGFRGSPHIGCEYFDNGSVSINDYDQAHIAQTYTAICTLAILGDNFHRFDKEAIIGSLRYLQEWNGGFRSMYMGGENDLRFIFCAFAISSMLNDWSGFDIDLSVAYLLSCQSFDGGFGLGVGYEGHGGSTYCAVASLFLCNKLHLANVNLLKGWCIARQGDGFSGRPNKPQDTCYSFWIGGVMKMLDIYDQSENNRSFSISCQSQSGGFSKVPKNHPDILHSYFSICGLSLMNQDGLKEIYPAWGLSISAKDRLEKKFGV